MLNKVKNFTPYIIILIFIFTLYTFNIRMCLIYNLFKIPCTGCGITRSIISLLHGDILLSLKYNILGIPLVILFIICVIWELYDIKNNKKTLKKFINKNSKIIIFICVIVSIICFIRNINNTLLYN